MCKHGFGIVHRGPLVAVLLEQRQVLGVVQAGCVGRVEHPLAEGVGEAVVVPQQRQQRAGLLERVHRKGVVVRAVHLADKARYVQFAPGSDHRTPLA